MGIEEAVFERKRVIMESLLPFGFVQTEQDYVYREKVLAGDFEVEVQVDSQGQVTGRVWDLDLEEEYTALHVATAIGNFVGQVREAYLEVLQRIAEACFENQLFSFPQTNRLANYLSTTFGDATDQPFAKFPTFTAFRHPVNQKWYGLVGKIQLGKLQVGQEDWLQEELETAVEIVNIKVKPEILSDLLSMDGIYPSYHMSKKTWVTIVLDGRVADEVLFNLVTESRHLVAPKSFVNGAGPDYWVIPANPKVFDIDTEFSETRVVYWTQKATIQAGDLVAMYITAPIRAIRYLCRVLEAQIDNTLYPEKTTKKLMKVELIHTFSDDEFPIEKMKLLGVKAVRGPRRMTKELMEAIKEVQLDDSIHDGNG